MKCTPAYDYHHFTYAYCFVLVVGYGQCVDKHSAVPRHQFQVHYLQVAAVVVVVDPADERAFGLAVA